MNHDPKLCSTAVCDLKLYEFAKTLTNQQLVMPHMRNKALFDDKLCQLTADLEKAGEKKRKEQKYKKIA